MKKKNKTTVVPQNTGAAFLQKACGHVIGWAVFFISLSVYVRTYDIAAVKISLFFCALAVMFSVWASFKSLSEKPFNKQLFLSFLPFIFFALWLFISFIINPYKISSLEDFLKQFLYIFIPFFIATSFSLKEVGTVVKFLTASAVICFAYGFLQITGLDIMPWADFFGKRIFSALGNPNMFADFVIFMNFIVLALYLRKFEKKYLLLFAAGLVNLYFTESKGAWLSFGVTLVFFVFLYVKYFPSNFIKKHSKFIWVVGVVLALASVILVVVFASKRMQSVDFRAITWRGIVQMSADKAFTGYGTGSFATVYPTYRRAEIFYIEKIHNNETQHAENEFLEVLTDNGIIGLTLFLWLLYFVFYLAFKKFKELRLDPKSQGPPAYYLLAFVSAAAAILIHSIFDVSMRFVSTGFLFWVFIGLILVLSGYETVVRPKELAGKGKWLTVAGAAVWLISAVALCFLVYIFSEVIGRESMLNTGRLLLKILAWAGVTTLCGALLYLYYRILKIRQSVLPCLFILITLPFFFAAERFVRADYYTNLGNYYAGLNNWSTSIKYYIKSFNTNPFNPSVRQFIANIAINRWNKYKTQEPGLEDKTALYQDDFERALYMFNLVYKAAPNHAQLHHQWGELYYKKGYDLYDDYFINKKDKSVYEEASKYFDLAKEKFEYSLLIDPVNPDTYFYMSNIALMQGNPQGALEWVDKYTRGPSMVKNDEYLKINKNNAKAAQMRQNILRQAGRYE
ncbi:O-antigen polymerase [Elusimicrobium minutum Pei191]|uniref:O-antigen polymerase n=1 Tax=Elusimicrobium minutum (strain Pei191) TaxID=445932 RepID=B2KDP4_ELUMP|nr:O-antigen ligase family protein [Elusimicrobium minutum]ACC98640.1 O-antigen polymerase [Elusimicrobium minutum Pei191]